MKYIFVSFLFSVFVLQVFGQLQIPNTQPKASKTSTPAKDAKVTIVWLGPGSVKLVFNNDEYLFTEGQEQTLGFNSGKAYSLKAVKPDKNYPFNDYLVFKPGNQYCNISLNNNELKIEKTISPAEKAEQERIAKQEWITKQKVEQEQIAQQKAEQEKIAQQKAEQELEAKRNILISINNNKVSITGGTFNMGSNDHVDDAKPVHSVTLSSFSVAKYPTTVAEYKAFCNVTGRAMPDAPSWGWNDNSPIVNVNYDDAIAYCNWLSGLSNKSYRLPTEAEYEYAARGGNKSNGYTYSGGNDLDEVGWFQDNSGQQTHPVGMKKPNELGLYDMSGNVWEWCSDWMGDYDSSPANNPKGPSSGTYRVMRGGSWLNTPTYCRVAYRYDSTPDYRLIIIGFRVVSPE